MADEETVVTLTFDARQSAQRAVEDSNKLIASLQSAAKSANTVSESLVKVNTSLSGVGRLAQKLENDFQPWNRAIRTAEGEYKKLNDAIVRLGASNSRSEDQENMFKRLVNLVPQVTKHIQQLQQTTVSLASGFNTVSPAAEKMINELKRLQVEQEKINKERFKFVEQIAPSSSVAENANRIAKANADVAKSAKEAADRVTYLSTRYNQDATAANNYRKTISELNEAFGKNIIGHRELGIETSKAINIYNRSTVEGEKLTKAHINLANAQNQSTSSSRTMQYALTNLSFQVNDVVSGLAMGQQPMRIFAQQAGQFVQIFQQAPNIISEAAAAIRGWITPTTLAVAGAAALAGGFLLVINRAIQLETQIRTLGVTLRTLGTDSLASSLDVQKMVPGLQAAGLSRSDALTSLQNTIQNIRINPQVAGRVVETGANVAATFGGDAVDRAKELTTALTGGVEATIKYAQSLNALTGAEASAALRMAELGKTAEATDFIFNKINTSVKGNLLASMGSGEKAVLALKNAWDSMLDTLGKSSIFTTVVDKLTQLAGVIERIAKGDPGTIARAATWTASKFIPGLGAIDSFTGMFPGGQNQPAATAAIPPMNNSSNSDLVALKAASTSNAQIQKINAEFANRLNAWLNALNDADRNLIKITSGFATSGHAADSNHYRGTAVDIRGMSPTAAARLREYNLSIGVQHPDHAHVEPGEIPPATSATAGARVAASRSFVAQTGGGTVLNPDAVQDAQHAINEYTNSLTKMLDVQQQQGMMQDLVRAKQEAETLAKKEGANETQTSTAVNDAAKGVLDRYAASLGITHKNQLIANQGVLDSAKGFGISTQAGLAAQAEAEARNIVLQRSGGLIGRENEIQQEKIIILKRLTAEALQGTLERQAAITPEIAAEQRLAEAMSKGAGAAHDMAIQNQAVAQTQQILNRLGIQESGINSELTDGIIKRTQSRLKELDVLKQIVAIRQSNIQSGNEIQSLKLQAGLVTGTTEEINRQVALLTEKQKLEAMGLNSSQEEYRNRLLVVDAVEKQKIVLADTQREWRRIEDLVRSLVDTITGALTSGIQNAFDGKKVEDWGTRIRSMLGGIVSQITNMAFIRPAIGSLLGGIGLTGLAQQYGNLGIGGGGGLSSLFGGSSSSGTTFQAVPDGNGGVSFKQIGDVAGVGKSLFDVFGSSGSSGGGFFSGIGDSFSSASNFLFGSSGGDFGGGGLLETGVADALGGPTSGILGSGGIGSVFSGIGAGFGAGSLINSLMGGDPLIGSLGSGAGSLIGMIGGPIGSLIGGALGGLVGGLFKKKPSNFAAGGNIDLASGGSISGLSNEGNAQNTQQANQIIKSISDFTKTLLASTGGSLAGNLNIQAGSRDGIKIAGSIGNVGSRQGSLAGEIKFESAEEAVKMTSLALVHHLENVSETMTTVLNSVTDLDQLDKAVSFVTVYESLKDAFDSAFASIDNDLKVIGPFESALNEINAIFAEVTKGAEEFGLALEPVNAGLVEAKERLTEDFNRSVQDSILAISDPFEFAMRELIKVNEALLKDAEAVGANRLEVERLNELKLAALRATQFEETAKLAEETVEVVEGVLVDVKSLIELQKRLTQGPDSGLTINEQIRVANDNYMQELDKVRAGDYTRVDTLAEEAGNVFSLSESAYGNAKQTADRRQEILEGIGPIISSGEVANRSFASGTDNTPEGWIKVGEEGPEWLHQEGGATILPSSRTLNSMKFGGENIKGEIQALKQEIINLREENSRVIKGVGQEEVKQLNNINNSLNRKSSEIHQRRAV